MLDLNGHPLGPAGTRLIASMLLKNRSISTLDLRATHMGDAGAKLHARGLSEHPAIEQVYIAVNGISYSGVRRLLGALQAP